MYVYRQRRPKVCLDISLERIDEGGPMERARPFIWGVCVWVWWTAGWVGRRWLEQLDEIHKSNSILKLSKDPSKFQLVGLMIIEIEGARVARPGRQTTIDGIERVELDEAHRSNRWSVRIPKTFSGWRIVKFFSNSLDENHHRNWITSQAFERLVKSEWMIS